MAFQWGMQPGQPVWTGQDPCVVVVATEHQRQLRGWFQDAEARKLVMCSDAEPDSNFYCTMPGNYSATGHYIEALRLDLLRLECSDSVDLMDAMPGSDRDDCQNHLGYLCGPSEGVH